MDNANIPFGAFKGTDPYIFVSYAHKDSDKVFPIISEFHKAGFYVWYDEGIDPGNEWPEDIAKALQKCSLFIVFISASAVESDNVRREINYALAKNKPFIHIWLEDASEILAQQYPGLEMQINSTQGIMHFRMEPENFYRKCLQSFETIGIKKDNEPTGKTAAAEENEYLAEIIDEIKALINGGNPPTYLIPYLQPLAAEGYTEIQQILNTLNSSKIKTKAPGSGLFETLGWAYQFANDDDNAIVVLTEAIKIDPQNSDLYWVRGAAYEDKKDYASAIADYTLSLKIQSDNAGSLFGRGCCYYETGKLKEALADLTKACKIDPTIQYYRELLETVKAAL